MLMAQASMSFQWRCCVIPFTCGILTSSIITGETGIESRLLVALVLNQLHVKVCYDLNKFMVTAADTLFNLPSVAESIISYASEQRADPIVIGTRGRSGSKRFVPGSVASAVVAHEGCPVIVVDKGGTPPAILSSSCFVCINV